jgi:hypothetical protein
MVASSAFIITANSERLRCGVFSIHETIHLGNFEFIVDYFSGLSLYPRRGNAGASFMGSAHSEASTPRRAMVEDSDEEFLMASSGEGSFGLPSPRVRGTRALLIPVRTTSWMENTPAAQVMLMVPPWKSASLSTNITLITGNSRCKLMLSSPTVKQAHRQIG